MTPRELDQIAGSVRRRLADRHPVLLCDFDGTLCEFDPDPASVFLEPRRAELLNEIAARGATLGLVSGRRISDLRLRIGDLRVEYVAGFHGLEIDGPESRFRHTGGAEAERLVREAKQLLERAVAALPGVFVEDKGLSLSLHYREASAASQVVAQARFTQLLAPILGTGALKVLPGAAVTELLPSVTRDKGSAVTWIRGDVDRRRGPVSVIYIGDDVTDEDAFAVLGEHDAGIGSSERVSLAEFHVEGPAGVEAILRALCSKLS